MSSIYTKECTQCYFSPLDPNHIPEFIKRKVRTVNQFDQRAFTSQDRFNCQLVKDALVVLQQRLFADKSNSNIYCELSSKKRQLNWKETVNKKRQFIKRVIQNQSLTSVAEISRFTKTCKDTVKRVMRDLASQGDVSPFEYNHLKSQEEVDGLQKTIEQIEEGFMTVSSIKRNHSSFSRKKILEALHGRGFRYRQLPKERKNPNLRIVDSTNVCRVISHIAQAMTDPNTTLLYCDEMKFPLYQTAEKRWVHKDSVPQEMMVAGDQGVGAPVPGQVEESDAWIV